MDEKEVKNNIPCIIETGILYNHKDIQKVLRDLSYVIYQHIVEDQIKSSGEAYIASVVANNSSANIIANKRIYLNVNGFEYMSLKQENDQTIIDLVDQFRTIRLIPLNTSDDDNAEGSASSSLDDDDFAEEYAEISEDELDEE
ncbi:MAG: hypothetical protein U0457_12555 [Candidatus Sericytochromatia bacterium]